jgi:hypothetical protein
LRSIHELMKDQLFIPNDLKVGYQKRSDTYTSNLGFVIYKDSRSQWRQEKSWEGWRDKSLEPKEFENKPTEGFVVNRDVGGVRRSYSSWHGRMEKVRVFDPRDFEIEITVENLLYILQEANSIKGKGLEGQFVYAWHNKQLVLLPTGAQEYENSTKFTALQSQKVSAKALIPGATYQTKGQENLIYLGKFFWHSFEYLSRKHQEVLNIPEPDRWYAYGSLTEKKFVFVDKLGRLMPLANVSSLAGVVSETCVSNYAELMDAFNQSIHSTKIVGISDVPSTVVITQLPDQWSRPDFKIEGSFYKKVGEDRYDEYYVRYEETDYDYRTHKPTRKGFAAAVAYTYKFINGELYKLHNSRRGHYDHYPVLYTKEQIENFGFVTLMVQMENGKSYPFEEYNRL